ncbi:unnamed protein product, partial [Polarella glacialis]
ALGGLAKSACTAIVESAPKPCCLAPGVEIAPLPGRGRSLLVSLRGEARLSGLKRGSQVLREYPLASVPLTGGGSSLHPETALALRLWSGAAELRHAAADLLDHGGRDASSRLRRAVVAVMFVMASSEGVYEAGAESVTRSESLFCWLGRVRVNSVAVTSLSEQSEGNELEVAKVALALYPELAKSVNHSCRPNCLLRFDPEDGLALELLVSAPGGVPPGEEITISYGPTAASLPRQERRAALLAQYGFECGCPACAILDEDFSWRSKAAALDERAKVAAGRGSWREAATASSAALALLRQGFAEGDLELAREECKLAGILLQAGDAARARTLWASAAAALAPLAPRGDPDLEEAQEMLKRLPEPKLDSKEPAGPKSQGTVPFAAAASHGDVGQALNCLRAVLEASSASAFISKDAQETTVSDSFDGVVLGLEGLNLTPAERERVMQAAQGTSPKCERTANARVARGKT